MSDQPSPLPLESILHDLITGRIDHNRLLRVPDLGSRSFWFGAALGVGAVLLLKARAASGTPAADRQP